MEQNVLHIERGWLVAWQQMQRVQSKGDGMARDHLQGSRKK